MKKLKNIFIAVFALCSLLLTSCGKDNFDSPNKHIKGQITYNGEGLQLKGTAEGDIELQLYQHGYKNFEPIYVQVRQDGSFEAELFDGSYELIEVPSRGPWQNVTDTVKFDTNGDSIINYPVVPFYTIYNVQYEYVDSTRELSARFKITNVSDTAFAEEAFLCISNTAFADQQYNDGIFRVGVSETDTTTTIQGVKVMDNPDSSGEFEISYIISEEAAESPVLNARMGLSVKNRDYAIYSPVVRILREDEIEE